MTAGDLRFQVVTVGELLEYTRGLDFAAGVIPLSPSRARAQTVNPFANSGDPALVVALLEGRRVGYVGLLPARFTDGARSWTVLWMTTYFVDPGVRGQGIAARIMEHTETLGRDILCTQHTLAAGRILKSVGFEAVGGLRFGELDFRRSAPWAAPTLAIRRKLRRRPEGILPFVARRLDGALAWPGKAFLFHRLGRRFTPRASVFRVETAVDLSETDLLAAGVEPESPRFERGAGAINWMLEYPWIRESGEPSVYADEISGDPSSESDDENRFSSYHFSQRRALFRQLPLRILRAGDGSPVGVMVLQVSDANGRTLVKLLDHGFSGEDTLSTGLSVAIETAASFVADSLILDGQLLNIVSEDEVLRRFLRRREREYLFYPGGDDPELGPAIRKARFRYTDSDVAFT